MYIKKYPSQEGIRIRRLYCMRWFRAHLNKVCLHILPSGRSFFIFYSSFHCLGEYIRNNLGSSICPKIKYNNKIDQILYEPEPGSEIEKDCLIIKGPRGLDMYFFLFYFICTVLLSAHLNELEYKRFPRLKVTIILTTAD